jgi:hypothetical protein
VQKLCIFEQNHGKLTLLQQKVVCHTHGFGIFCPKFLKSSNQNFIFVALLLEIVSKHVFCLILGKICPGKIEMP